MNRKIVFLTWLFVILIFGCSPPEADIKPTIAETEAAKPTSTFAPEPTEKQTSESIIIPFSRTFLASHTFYSGPGYFKFAIVDGFGITWSNDGAAPPIASVPLTVSNGKLNVNLGDTSLTGMTQSITAEAFKHQITFLQIWFSSDEVTWEQLPYYQIAAPDTLQDLAAAKNDDEMIASEIEFPTGIFMQATKNEMTLQIDEDGSYIVRLNGLVDATGSYTINGNQYTDDTNYGPCRDVRIATYTWTYVGTWLTFEVVGEDECGERNNDMNGMTWIKKDVVVDQ